MKEQNRKHLFFLLLWFGLLNLHVLAQDKSFSYKQYGSENGLPSSEVYEVLQDKKGFIWFCSDAGVSRFNGYEFENFNTQDGLTDNTIFHFYEDFKGRIWFLTFNSRLCYFENDSIHTYEHNQLIKQGLTEGWVRSISIDSNETLYYTGSRYGYGSISKNGLLDFIKPIPSDTGEVAFKKIGKDLLVYGTKANKNSQNDYFIEPNAKTLISYTDKSLSRYNIYQKWLGNNRFIFNVGGRTGYYNNGSVKFLNRIKGLHQAFIDDKNRLWLAYHNNGILIYNSLEDAFDEKEPINHIFQGKNITYIFKDNEGAIWVTTQNNGVYYLPNINVDVFSMKGDELTNRISTITMDNQGNIYFGTFDSQVFKISKDWSFSLFKSNFKSDKNSISKIDFVDVSDAQKPTIHTETYLKAKNNTHWVIKTNKLWGFKGQDTILSPKDYAKSLRFNTVFENKENQIFIATLEGLFTYKDSKMVKVSDSLPFASIRIEDIDELVDGTLIIGTKDKGLYLWKNDMVLKIPANDDLTSPIIRDIHVDKDDDIWISTPNGVNRLTKMDNQYFVQKITDIHGLPSKEVNAVTSVDDMIWVATNKGIANFKKDDILTNKEKPPLYITGISINEENCPIQSAYNLSYNQNYLEIDFIGLAYHNAGNVLYRYQMEGIDENWIESYATKVRYSSLNYGDYKFKVQVINEDGVWSNSEMLIFQINPPFWLESWFILLTVLLMITFLFLLYRFNEKRKLNKAKQKRILEQQKLLAAKSELKALRAQMNPHFTFNTLSAIQSAINSDSINASEYIVDFAKLIRKVLENSKHSYIDISEEIETLELYVKLEQLRFSHKFSYNIEVDENISFIEIPSMVIQPFVENAIIHGLSAKKENGTLKIQFFLKNNQLVCIVEDNGVGRDYTLKAKKASKLSHQSMGMDITKERLNIYKTEFESDVSMKIIDLIDDFGHPLGTKVELHFPI